MSKVDKYDKSTQEILKTQLGGVLDKRRTTATTTVDNSITFDPYDPYDDEYTHLDVLYADDPSQEETKYAEQLIESMELNPSKVYQVATYESGSVLGEILRLLLLR
jgi:hypothetical protein